MLASLVRIFCLVFLYSGMHVFVCTIFILLFDICCSTFSRMVSKHCRTSENYGDHISQCLGYAITVMCFRINRCNRITMIICLMNMIYGINNTISSPAQTLLVCVTIPW